MGHSPLTNGFWISSSARMDISLKGGPTAPGETMSPVYDPSTGRPIAHVTLGSQHDVADAVNSAHKAFEDGRWRNLRPADRERILLRFADLIESNAEFLAQLETLEQGKSINIAPPCRSGRRDRVGALRRRPLPQR